MRLVTFPFFVVALSGRLVLTVVEAAFSQLVAKKIVLTNIVLTIAALFLLTLFWTLLPMAAPTHPKLGISLEKVSGLEVQYRVIKTAELENALHAYEYGVLQQPFISQHQYVNLAILAATAGQTDLAADFLKLARHIDPNQSYFED